jgi:hypothetical protein
MGNAHSATLDTGLELEVESLRQKHNQLKKQLDVLNRHISLTPGEQVEVARLKKEKLWLKDRIAALGGQV